MTWEAFRTYETRDALVKRFGAKVGEKIPLDYSPTPDKDLVDVSDDLKRAQIWEVWDKDSKKVYWISETHPDILDTKPDPLGLKDFFSSSSIYATTTTDSLVPVPDYVLYQSHAVTLDIIQKRTAAILDCIRANGVYNAAHGVDLGNILKQDDGKLYPINNYRDLTEKGGFAGIMEFTPIDQFIKVLDVLYSAGDREVQKVYEITGISDVIRGASDPRETAKAQQLKGQYGNLRLSARQSAVQEWLRDGIQKIGEIICEHFDPERIRQISGYDLMPDANPQDPSEWMQIYQTLKTEVIREYKITIETDSTIATDTQAQKEAWQDYLESTAAFLQTAVGAVQVTPELAPYFKEALLQTSRAHRAGSSLEDVLASSFDTLVQRLQQPAPPPPPDPAIEVANIRAEVDRENNAIDRERIATQNQTKADQAQLKAETDMQKLQTKHETDMAKIEAKVESDMNKLLLEMRKLTEEIKMREAELEAEFRMREAELRAELLQARLEAATARLEGDEKVKASENGKPKKMKVDLKIERDPETELMTGVKGTQTPTGGD